MSPVLPGSGEAHGAASLEHRRPRRAQPDQLRGIGPPQGDAVSWPQEQSQAAVTGTYRLPVRQPRPHRALRTGSLSLEVFGLFFVFPVFCFVFPLFCRVNLSGMKFGWDAKGKWLLTRLSHRKEAACSETRKLFTGVGWCRRGTEESQTLTFYQVKSFSIQQKSVRWYTGVPNIRFLQTQLIQHKTKKQAGLKLALVSSQG